MGCGWPAFPHRLHFAAVAARYSIVAVGPHSPIGYTMLIGSVSAIMLRLARIPPSATLHQRGTADRTRLRLARIPPSATLSCKKVKRLLLLRLARIPPSATLASVCMVVLTLLRLARIPPSATLAASDFLHYRKLRLARIPPSATLLVRDNDLCGSCGWPAFPHRLHFIPLRCEGARVAVGPHSPIGYTRTIRSVSW